MKAVVATFNQEKALVGAFSVNTDLRMDLFEALVRSGDQSWGEVSNCEDSRGIAAAASCSAAVLQTTTRTLQRLTPSRCWSVIMCIMQSEYGYKLL